MTESDVRVMVYERPASVMKLTLVEPGKPFMAMALTGSLPKKPKVEASGYGETADAAVDALEAAVMAPPPTKPTRIRAGKPLTGPDTRKYHLAQAADPEQAFRSTCPVPGCGKTVIRLSGVAARRSEWRHAKPTEHF